MIFVTGKHIPRRTLLRGLGATIALPVLDAMMPARARSETLKSPVRMAFMYAPNGIIMNDWTPKTEGANFEFRRIMRPLEPFREHTLVFTGLAHRTGDGAAGDHARASATYLTGVGPKRTTGGDIQAGISVDQVAAQFLGSKTRLPSLELGCEASRSVGSCDAGYSCAYINSMSWSGPSTPNPPQTNPRLVFERLYGSLASDPNPLVQARLDADRRSVLDAVMGRTQQLLGTLGPADRRKMDEYLTAIREIERRIAATETEDRQLTPDMAKPSGTPPEFEAHARLMNDLLLMAFQADLTRIATLIYSKESSTRSYPELGFSDPHHPLTHHRNIPENVEKVAQINCHHFKQFADFIRKAKAVDEGDGTLLDHSMFVYGSSISDGNRHIHEDLPVVMVGKGDGSLKTGRHVVYPETPMTNLYVAMLARLGVAEEKLGDSTGEAGQLTDL